MRSYRSALVLALSVPAALMLSWTRLGAQMPSGQHHTGTQTHQTHGAMQGNMAAMNQMNQMLRNVEGMMTNTAGIMRDLAAMHTGMGAGQHDQMMSSMQGLLDQMRQFHGSMSELMKAPTLHQNNEAMKGLQQACRDLERMASSLQEMSKHMAQAMKGMAHGPNK